MPRAFDLAKQPGGKHHGWYLQQLKLSAEELESGIRSFERQIQKHQGWIADPLSKIPDFGSFHPQRQQALVLKLASRHRATPPVHRDPARRAQGEAQ
jgi:hypothetical protein